MKNRRSRSAKITEYKLEKLVRCFAKNMTAKETMEEMKLSEPTVRHRFMQIRQLLYDHGPMRMDHSKVEGRPAKDRPAKYIYERQYRGVKEKYAHLFEMEVLNRIIATKNDKAVRRFLANNEEHMEQVKKYATYNKLHDKYDIIEVLNATHGKRLSEHETRPFDMLDYEENSLIIINEYNIEPDEAFFRVIWNLLRKHPLNLPKDQA